MPNKIYKDDKYEKTLNSPHWKSLRRQKYKEQGGRCLHCDQYKQAHQLELHHLHYDTLGEEKSEDVEMLCKLCHLIADRHRHLQKSLDTFHDRYWENHNNEECPNSVLIKFIQTKLCRGVSREVARDILEDYFDNNYAPFMEKLQLAREFNS